MSIFQNPRTLRVVARRFASAFLCLLAGCDPYLGTTAASVLRKTADTDPNIRYYAYDKLASQNIYEDDTQKTLAARTLASAYISGREGDATRAVVCRTLGELKRPEGRIALRKAIDDPNDIVRAEACRALGRLGDPEDAGELARVMAADKSIDCQVAAIDGLGELKPKDPRYSVLLADDMDHPEPGVRYAAYKALRKATGKDLGLDAEVWRKYLERVDNNKKPIARTSP